MSILPRPYRAALFSLFALISIFVQVLSAEKTEVQAVRGAIGHKCHKLLPKKRRPVDKRETSLIMRATEQSMIEARKRRVCTTQGGGNRRCERLFCRRVSAFPDGYTWVVGEDPADCRPLFGRRAVRQTPCAALLVMNSICSVHDFLFIKEAFPCTVPSGRCCPPSSPSRWR